MTFDAHGSHELTVDGRVLVEERIAEAGSR